MFSYLHLSVPSKSSFIFMVIDCCLRPQEKLGSLTVIYHNHGSAILPQQQTAWLLPISNCKSQKIYPKSHRARSFYFNTIHAYSVVPGTNGFYLI